MEDTSCSACREKFQDESPPKMLECGHNVCAKCLEKILESDSVTRCAICQAEITKKESWPTNHSLLSVSRFCNKLLNDEKHVKTSIAEFQGDIMEKVTAITTEKNNALGNIGTNVETAKVETLKMDDFNYRKDYLYEVSQRCKTGHVYAIYIIGKEQKFGQVTVFDDRIWVHCASEWIPKQEKNLIHVLFQDLKDSIGGSDFNVFLQVGCDEFGLEEVVEVIPNGQSLQFVKLCTGETGPSYKGTIGRKEMALQNSKFEPLLFIYNYIFNGKPKTGTIDYRYHACTLCKAGQYVVDGYDDGRFEIIKINYDGEFNGILGIIVSPCNFLHKITLDSKFDNKILDCGIIFQIK